MNSSKILIAVDNSISAQDLEKALQGFGLAEGSKVMLIHAIEPSDAIAAWPSEEYRKQAKLYLNVMSDLLKCEFPKLEVEAQLVDGYAKEEIIQYAKNWPADLIIIGSHGGKGLTRFLLGSVSSAVVSHALCPVLVLRNATIKKENKKLIASQTRAT